ncbi:MAG: asparagine synthase-related protein [Cyclonatronaceae bacterium]
MDPQSPELLCFDGSYIDSGKFYSGPDAAKHFKFLIEQHGAVKAAGFIDGFFRFVAGDDRHTWFGADHLGSYPLFYRTEPDFSWSVHAGKMDTDPVPDDQSLCCLLACGYVTGNHTLYKGVLEAEPGVVHTWHHKQRKLETSSPSKPANPAPPPVPDFGKLDELSSALFRAESANTEPLKFTLSLSGGLDSRIILAQALRHGIEPSAFSYGKWNTPDQRIAKKICRELDIPWTFHNYGDHRALINDQQRHSRFADHAFSGRSIPHEQDYISGHLTPPGSLILGGHSGDLIAGSYLTPELALTGSEKAFTDLMFYRHAQLTPVTGRRFYDVVRQRLAESFAGMDTSRGGIERAALRFNQLNRQRRYIVNSVRAYTLHDIPFFLPLYTKGMVDFFSGLPAEEKLDQKFYKQFATEFLFKGDLALMAEFPSTRPLTAAYKPAGFAERLKFRIRNLDRYKLRKRLFRSQATGYATPLCFMMDETTDRSISRKRIADHFPFLPALAAEFDDSGCPVAAGHIRKLQRLRGSQLNINGFYVLYYLGMLFGGKKKDDV